MLNFKTRLAATLWTAIAACCASGPLQISQALADAAATAADTDNSLDEVIVTGSRQSGLKASDSAAPIQILSSESIQIASGSPDLVSTLARIVPSLTAQGFGSDTANATLQAKLRGLSPNDVLVLVDGKRRCVRRRISPRRLSTRRG
jgi:iron complex outermembrane receptor protein